MCEPGGHNQYRPGHVLDCFGGSGTTAVAAALEARDCTLIDLDPRNVELVDRRLRETVRVLEMTRTVKHTYRRRTHAEGYGGRTPPTGRPLSAVISTAQIVWTVELAPLSELAAEAAGQLGLFEGSL